MTKHIYIIMSGALDKSDNEIIPSVPDISFNTRKEANNFINKLADEDERMSLKTKRKNNYIETYDPDLPNNRIFYKIIKILMPKKPKKK